MSIRRETRPAYHLMFAHAVCTLALVGVTLMFTPVADANDDVGYADLPHAVGHRHKEPCATLFEKLLASVFDLAFGGASHSFSR